MERSKQKFVTIFDPKTPVDFVGKGKIAVILGFGLSAVTLLGFLVLGVNWGIDFAGGTEMQVKFAKAVEPADVKKLLEEEGFHKHQVQSYGDAANNEILVRVERITTTTDEDIAKIKATAAQAFAADLKGAPPQIDFNASEGDRIHVVLPVPAAAAASPDEDPAAVALGAASAQLRALEAQQATLVKVIEEQSGLKLRRTKNLETNVESTADAIVRDEPYQGRVHYLVQFQGVTDKLQRAFTSRFGDAEIRRVDFVDASVAAQLRTDGLLALVFAMIGILIYVAIRFDFFFAPGAVIALAHDPIGAMAIFAFGRVEFDLPSIAALLTIVGYSITNTIVIYDRIRETTPVTKVPLTHDEMSKLVNTAVNDTLSRTINATLTTFLTALAVAIFTDGAVRNFAIVLCLGIVLGAFSSTYVAPAIYLFFRKNFFNPETGQKATGPTREERARGIV